MAATMDKAGNGSPTWSGHLMHGSHCSQKEWAQAGLPLGRAERGLMFEIGDWWLSGAVFGRGVRKQIVTAQGWRGPSYDSCRVAATVARRFPVELRRLNAGFVHHQAVRALPDATALPLLDRAIRENWNQNTIRVEAARVRNARDLNGTDIVSDLPTLIAQRRKFRAILADPPWRMSETLGKRGAVDTYYPSMELDAIKRLPVAAIADPRAFLFLWCSAVILLDAIDVLEAWGFTYKTNMVWDKVHGFGLGYYFRMRHEHLLVGCAAKAPSHFDDTSMSSVVALQRTAHSEKPPIVHDIVQRATVVETAKFEIPNAAFGTVEVPKPASHSRNSCVDRKGASYENGAESDKSRPAT